MRGPAVVRSEQLKRPSPELQSAYIDADLSTEKADISAKKSVEKCPLMCYTVSVSKQV